MVALRGGHHCTQPLMHKLGVESTARASFYFYNTKAEVDRFVEVVKEIRSSSRRKLRCARCSVAIDNLEFAVFPKKFPIWLIEYEINPGFVDSSDLKVGFVDEFHPMIGFATLEFSEELSSESLKLAVNLRTARPAPKPMSVRNVRFPASQAVMATCSDSSALDFATRCNRWIAASRKSLQIEADFPWNKMSLPHP